MSGGNEDVRVDKSADFGIIIPALEIIERGLSVVDLANGCD